MHMNISVWITDLLYHTSVVGIYSGEVCDSSGLYEGQRLGQTAGDVRGQTILAQIKGKLRGK